MTDTFELPDTIAALAVRPFEFSKTGWEEATALLAGEPDAVFHRLLRDQESDATFLAARRILHAFLPHEGNTGSLAVQVLEVRDELAPIVDSLAGGDDDVRQAVLRQRAPLGLLGGCWLEAVSQPATQPSIVVNRLFAHHFAQRGAGNPEHAVPTVRRRALQRLDVHLPEIGAADFLRRAQARPLTALHACFYLSLARLPANFLPEVVGVHYAFHLLGVDDRLTGTSAGQPEPALHELLEEYLSLAGNEEQRRLRAAVRLTLELEREHVGMLAELVDWRAGLSLESKVAEIVGRHAPLAGRQHGGVRVGARLLSETFTDPALDLAAFLTEFRESGHVRTSPDGLSRFIKAMKFGGPMFGIFDEREAATFREWVATVQAGERPQIEISVNTTGDAAAARWRAAIDASRPADVVVAEPEPRDDREFFYRLVNIENFPNTLPLAAQRAERTFADAEVLFLHGAGGRYTDATWFDYDAEALYRRAEQVYWDKLVNPYQPLTEFPDRDTVIFTQTTYLLGYLIDGAWLHRLGHLGHGERESDSMLFAIYADEMGHGDLRKNHITLTHRVLASLGITLPHIREAAFIDQAELPDDLYGFSVHQLCMCLFPDRFYNEILGYNLAIEMFGSGELRLHEAQKLRHHGFDDCYEAAHLAIDNFSAGHTRQAADIIVSYLDNVERTVGASAVPGEWRRIWRGYASFAYFVEHALLTALATEDPTAELVI
ncbi:MAG: iron-containing redox enzyme family protein [Labedaea sp.]